MWIILCQYDRLTESPTIVHGAARGADLLAAHVAEELGYEVEAHPAQWDLHGRSAGFIRNEAMAQSDVDLVIAFPGGRGTADMIRRAESYSIPVRRIT